MNIKNKLFLFKDILLSNPIKIKILPVINEIDVKKKLIGKLNRTIIEKKYKLINFYLNDENFKNAINKLDYPKYMYHPNSKIIMTNPYLNIKDGMDYEKSMINLTENPNFIPNNNLRLLILNTKKEKINHLIKINTKIVFNLYNNIYTFILRIAHYLNNSNLIKLNQTIKKFNNYLNNRDNILNISETTDILELLISIWFNLPNKYNKKNKNIDDKNNILILGLLKSAIIDYFNLIWDNKLNNDLSWKTHDPPLFYDYFKNLIKRLDI